MFFDRIHFRGKRQSKTCMFLEDSPEQLQVSQEKAGEAFGRGWNYLVTIVMRGEAYSKMYSLIFYVALALGEESSKYMRSLIAFILEVKRHFSCSHFKTSGTLFMVNYKVPHNTLQKYKNTIQKKLRDFKVNIIELVIKDGFESTELN